MSLMDFVQESNKIEGIIREPTEEELVAHETLLALDTITVADLQAFVFAIQPGARLRETGDMNVRIGNHIAPRGGPAVVAKLEWLLCGLVTCDPYEVHRSYEELHPFMDGNGRSGRAIWLWMMNQRRQGQRAVQMGFLHLWYYQSLDAAR